MFHETDYEFFQDLMHFCSDPAKEEPTAIDSPLMKREENSDNTDTLHTTFSPQGWDGLDANSPAQAGIHSLTPNEPLSPNMEGFTNFNSNFYSVEDKTQLLEPLDILNLPVVLGDLASEDMVDLNLCRPVAEPTDYYNNTTQDTEHTPATNMHKMLLHNVDEDSLDMKLGAVIMGDVENHIFCNKDDKRGVESRIQPEPQLTLNLAAATAPWSSATISTPEVLSYVEQMEKEKCLPIMKPLPTWPVNDTEYVSMDDCSKTMLSTSADFETLSPKSENHMESEGEVVKSYNTRRKRHSSEDSDKSYTPYNEQPSRKYKRRRPNLPIKDMIIALEESQQLPKARRGRPPKRRESNVSSACSFDDTASCVSSHEVKYRHDRDKNNEASKKSRMKRKLKELQMEQLVIDLEERNKKLKVKADILEDMTKRLKDALMSAIIQK